MLKKKSRLSFVFTGSVNQQIICTRFFGTDFAIVHQCKVYLKFLIFDAQQQQAFFNLDPISKQSTQMTNVYIIWSPSHIYAHEKNDS